MINVFLSSMSTWSNLQSVGLSFMTSFVGAGVLSEANQVSLSEPWAPVITPVEGSGLVSSAVTSAGSPEEIPGAAGTGASLIL